mgnify:CR=1 FL=1
MIKGALPALLLAPPAAAQSLTGTWSCIEDEGAIADDDHLTRQARVFAPRPT